MVSSNDPHELNQNSAHQNKDTNHLISENDDCPNNSENHKEKKHKKDKDGKKKKHKKHKKDKEGKKHKKSKKHKKEGKDKSGSQENHVKGGDKSPMADQSSSTDPT